jgi:membrane associated rhomboid family serine protease
VRIPRTATVAITIVTAAFWLVAFIVGLSDAAVVYLGFIPDRWSGAVLVGPAVPAALTPLSATLVHAGFLHLALNLVIFLWCGTAVERILGSGP